MKIFLQPDGDEPLMFLAGDGRFSERIFSSVADFELTGELENSVVRRVRGGYATPKARGNLRHRAFFRTRRTFPTTAEATAYIALTQEAFPRRGQVYFVTGEGTRKLLGARISPPVAKADGCTVSLQYQVEGGEFTPLNPELVIDGLTDNLRTRFVTIAGEIFWEVGFVSPVQLVGNGISGWTDTDGHLLAKLYRSENLVNWDEEWLPVPTSPEASGSDWIHWLRSRFPRQSEVKSGSLVMRSVTRWGGELGTFTGDTRNNPIQSVIIAGVSLALGGFPYTMGNPGEAARLQTALRVFYPTATVTASSNTEWEIAIPLVNLTTTQQINRVTWPAYLVPDMFGQLTNTINGADFHGEFVNAAGVRTAVTKQFARLGVSAGPNHLY
jgi:hypothetical protein